MTKFVLLFLPIFVLVACSSGELEIAFDDLPSGDAGRGAELFTQQISGAWACSDCHRLDVGPHSGGLRGPGFEGLGERAGNRVDGQSAGEYIYTSILYPSRYIVSGRLDVMDKGYKEKLTAQVLADLIAFALEQ